MTAVNHQTIRLGRGKHASPAEGACVMELASMLAGEAFTDHPVSVCPVIGALLRTYNDCIDDGRRQDLYAYASKIVGSRASEDVERARQACLERWITEVRRQRRSRFRLPRWLGLLYGGAGPDVQAAVAVYEVSRRGAAGHRRALRLIDELLAIGVPAGGEQSELRHSVRSRDATRAPGPLVGGRGD